MKEEIKSHPAYGLIGISRRSSSHGVPLFGSSIQHKETLTITISEAELRRDLSKDWYYGRREIIEVELSQSQFAEFITTPNIGSGVPCTIKAIYNERTPEVKFESKKDVFKKEFQDQMSEIANEDTRYMKEALELLETKPNLTKKDREVILKAIKLRTQDLKSNMPFVFNSFQDQMDKTVTEAKAEVEAFYEHKVRSLGLEALRSQMPELSEATVPQLTEGEE